MLDGSLKEINCLELDVNRYDIGTFHKDIKCITAQYFVHFRGSFLFYFIKRKTEEKCPFSRDKLVSTLHFDDFLSIIKIVTSYVYNDV